MTESLFKRVQTVLENKGAQTRYSLSSLLEMYKLCFCLIFCIYIYVCMCLNKSLHLFPIFLVICKETELWTEQLYKILKFQTCQILSLIYCRIIYKIQ